MSLPQTVFPGVEITVSLSWAKSFHWGLHFWDRLAWMGLQGEIRNIRRGPEMLGGKERKAGAGCQKTWRTPKTSFAVFPMVHVP